MARKITIYLFLYTVTFLIIFSVFTLVPLRKDPYSLLQLMIILFMSLLIIKYTKAILLILIAPWNVVVKTIRENRYPSAKYKPKVSVIIPAYNEEIGLLNTVKTVLNSKYKNTEIIVVNDGSTDKSHDMMSSFVEKLSKTSFGGGGSIKILL